MNLRIAVLLLALTACGQTDRNDAPGGGIAGDDGTSGAAGARAAAGTGGTAEPTLPAAGAGGAAGAPMVPGAGGSAEQSCLYPSRGLELEPSPDRPPQRYRLSEPFSLDALPAHHQVAATYDVNGDAVSDLLLLDTQASPPRFRLLLTAQPPDVLDFSVQDCAALRQLPGGRLLLRDLNDDGAPDFVVGTTRGVQAFLNREDGLRPVLEYDLPSPTERASLINVGLADLNGDQRSDLVVSFDRLISETSLDFEIRAQAFLQQPDERFEPGLAVATRFRQGEVEGSTLYTGYLTAGRFRPDDQGSALLVGRRQISSSFPFVLQSTFGGGEPTALESAFGQEVQQVFAVPRADAHSLVLAVGKTDFFLVDLSSPDSDPPTSVPPHIVAEGALMFGGGSSHELGGGPESPRHFVFDIDHDGDLDFLERDPQDPGLALHVNFGNQRFDAPQVLSVNVSSTAETPFIQLGPGAAVVGRPQPGLPDSAIYSLVLEAD